MYPNLFVIGAAKSGTTSLHYYLSRHPQVHMSSEKEPNFFSANEQWPRHAVRDPREYQSLFQTDLPVRGESSVTYSYWPYPSGVPERIYAVAPDAKFIYIVRDPVDRLISHYRHRVGLGEEQRSLLDVMRTPNEAQERYVTASSYATQLVQYLEYFSQEAFLIIDHAELRSARNAILQECFRFLNVEADFVSPDWDRLLNETSSQRRYSPMADRIRHSKPYRATLDWFDPGSRERIVSPVRRLLTREVRRHEVVTESLRQHYAELLIPEMQRFRDLTGRAFPHWTV